MDAQTAPRARLHPLVATAAVAVILASAVGIAAMTGLLPGRNAKQDEPTALAAAPVPPIPAPAPVAEPAPIAATPAPVVVPEHKPAPRHVARVKPVVHHGAPVHAEPAQTQPLQTAQAVVPAPGSYPPVPPDYHPAQAAPVQAQPAPVTIAAARPACAECGTVESMREVDHKGEATGAGAVAGGLGGLVLGHQVGNGSGNQIATVLGAIGGAIAGHEIEKKVRTTKDYEIGVRMEDGSYRTITTTSAPSWRAGDHVRVVDGTLQADNR